LHTLKGGEVKLPKFKKKYAASALAAGLVMGGAGIAAAYFSATGSGTGKTSVGGAVPFKVTQNTLTGMLYPGTHQAVSFNVHNTGTGIQHYTITASDMTAAMNATGTIITANTGKAVPGCKASWFTVAPASAVQAGTLTPGQSTTLNALVAMNNGTGTGSTQNACQTSFPQLNVAFGGPAGFALFEADGGTAAWTNNKTTANLTLPTGTPAGGAAGFEVVNVPATLPATAPTFTTTSKAEGSPRWVIFFTTGGHATGNNTEGGAWTTHDPTYHYGVSWTMVKSEFAGKHVTQAFLVMTTGQTPPSTATITNVTYGGKGF
jgi:hypothetical protein